MRPPPVVVVLRISFTNGGTSRRRERSGAPYSVDAHEVQRAPASARCFGASEPRGGGGGGAHSICLVISSSCPRSGRSLRDRQLRRHTGVTSILTCAPPARTKRSFTALSDLRAPNWTDAPRHAPLCTLSATRLTAAFMPTSDGYGEAWKVANEEVGRGGAAEDPIPRLRSVEAPASVCSDLRGSQPPRSRPTWPGRQPTGWV